MAPHANSVLLLFLFILYFNRHFKIIEILFCCYKERIEYRNYLEKKIKKPKIKATKKEKTNVYGKPFPNFDEWSLFNTLNDLNFSLPSVNSSDEFLLMNVEMERDCMVNALEFYAFQIPLSFELTLDSRISVQVKKS